MRWPPPPDWPQAALSRQVLCRPHRWHVQQDGSGPMLLLIHGAGGASQSFRDLFPLLAARHHVAMIDLPGQGFSQSGARSRSGLDAMAEDLLKLIRHQGWRPAALIGHSAGAALALRLAEMGAAPGGQVIGINAALGEFKGVAGWLFPMLARALALTPFSAGIFTATVTPASVGRLLAGTGSRLDARGQALYFALARDPGHVDGTLAMMAQWQLRGLIARLSDQPLPVTLFTGAQDRAVPPATSRDAARRLPRATHVDLPGLGHLAHEEAPELFAERIAGLIAAAPSGP